MQLQSSPEDALTNREIHRELNAINTCRAARSCCKDVQVGKEAFFSASFSLHGRKNKMQQLYNGLETVLMYWHCVVAKGILHFYVSVVW